MGPPRAQPKTRRATGGPHPADGVSGSRRFFRIHCTGRSNRPYRQLMIREIRTHGDSKLKPGLGHGMCPGGDGCRPRGTGRTRTARSEEHTSELQSLMRISYAVFCLKKKKTTKHTKTHTAKKYPRTTT